MGVGSVELGINDSQFRIPHSPFTLSIDGREAPISNHNLSARRNIANLPRDRDYVGTLGALAYALLDLRAHAYLEPLCAALAEYPEHFAADGSFGCEPVPKLMERLVV